MVVERNLPPTSPDMQQNPSYCITVKSSTTKDTSTWSRVRDLLVPAGYEMDEKDKMALCESYVRGDSVSLDSFSAASLTVKIIGIYSRHLHSKQHFSHAAVHSLG